MSSYWSRAGLASLVGGACFYIWKSGVIQRYFAKESEPVADRFVKTVGKRLSEEKKTAIFQKFSAGKMNIYEDLWEQPLLEHIQRRRNRFYRGALRGVERAIKQGDTHYEVDGVSYPIDKVLGVLKREMGNNSSCLVSAEGLDETELEIAEMYKGEINRDIQRELYSNSQHRFSQVFKAIQQGKLKIDDIDRVMAERNAELRQAVQTVSRLRSQVIEYRKLPKTAASITDSQRKLKDTVEQRSKLLDQILRANKPDNKEFDIGFDEALLPNFVSGSISDLGRDTERNILNLEMDHKLQNNIERLREKLLDAQFPQQPLLKAVKLGDIIKGHINESFPIHTDDAEEILLKLNPYSRKNLLGDYISDKEGEGLAVCRHKAYLTKVIGDQLGKEFGFDVSLNSGSYKDLGHHTWNMARIGDAVYFLDAHNDIFLPDCPELRKIYLQGNRIPLKSNSTSIIAG